MDYYFKTWVCAPISFFDVFNKIPAEHFGNDPNSKALDSLDEIIEFQLTERANSLKSILKKGGSDSDSFSMKIEEMINYTIIIIKAREIKHKIKAIRNRGIVLSKLPQHPDLPSTSIPPIISEPSEQVPISNSKLSDLDSCFHLNVFKENIQNATKDELKIALNDLKSFITNYPPLIKQQQITEKLCACLEKKISELQGQKPNAPSISTPPSLPAKRN